MIKTTTERRKKDSGALGDWVAYASVRSPHGYGLLYGSFKGRPSDADMAWLVAAARKQCLKEVLKFRRKRAAA